MNRGLALAGMAIVAAVAAGLWRPRATTTSDDRFISMEEDARWWRLTGGLSGASGGLREAIRRSAVERTPAELVADLASEDPDDATPGALLALGFNATPALLGAIDDPLFRLPYGPGHEERSDFRSPGRTPLETVLFCLASRPPAEPTVALLALATDRNPNIRAEAGRVIGAMGADGCIQAVESLLADADDRVVALTLMGIEQSMVSRRASVAFRRGVFDGVAALVETTNRDVSGLVSRCLPKLDEGRAMEALASVQALRWDNPDLHNLLGTLARAKRGPDGAALMALIDDIDRNHGDPRALGRSLELLGECRSASGRAALERYLSSPIKEAREGAAVGLVKQLGIDDPFQFAGARADVVGWAGLTEPQRLALAMADLITEVENGGFAQYFENPSGAHWRDAVDATRVMSTPHDVDVLDRVAARFAWGEPMGCSALRAVQLALIARTAARPEDPFGDLDNAYFRDEDDHWVKLYLYIAAHAEDFGGASARDHP